MSPDTVCALCPNPHHAKGLCTTHYLRAKRNGNPNDPGKYERRTGTPPPIIDGRVELANGKGHALIDPEDAPLAAAHFWVLDGGGYARAARNGPFLHQLILSTDEQVDHVSRDRLDNRRVNLRPASQTQQLGNASKRPGTTSRYKGVSRVPSGRWRAQCDGRQVGTFDTEEAAADAYDEAALAAFGAFAATNKDLGLR